MEAWESTLAIVLSMAIIAVMEWCRRRRRPGRPQCLNLVQDEALGCQRVEQTAAQKRGLRLVCISDTHGSHRQLTLPDGDVLVHAGDFTQYGREDQAHDFNEWLADQPHKTKLVVLGNHEANAPWAKQAEEVLSNAILLRQSAYDLEVPGSEAPLRFFGTDFFWPCSGGNPYFDQISEGTDVLLAHGPAKGCADGDKGCPALLKAVSTIQPKLVVSGHIHFARGAVMLRHSSKAVSTTLINAANCGSGRQERTLVHGPVVVDV